MWMWWKHWKCNENISANFRFRKNISYFQILINPRPYITHNENIASFNVLHKPFIRIYVIFLLDISL
jgi:hypothetical protein